MISNVKFAVVVLLFVRVLPVDGQTSAEFERILIPLVATRQPGAYGSVWTTEFRARHEGNIDLVLGYDNGDDPKLIAPNTTYSPRLFAHLPGEPEGQFLYIRRSQSATSHFSLVIRDESRGAGSSGFTVPVVRETDLLVGRQYLLGVSTNGALRRTLRIYDASGETGAEFDIRVFDEYLQTAVASMRVIVIGTSRMLAPDAPLRPSSITVDLDQLFPLIRSYDRVTVEITPRHETQRWWTFVSVTNNETQDVTVILP